MKILIVTSFPDNPQTPSGGVETVSLNLVTSLSEIDDNEIHVVTFDVNAASEKIVECEGAVVHRLPRPRGSTLATALLGGGNIIESFAKALNPDVVHAHDTYGLMTAALPVPRIFTIHGFIHGDILVSSTRFRWIRSRVWRHFETGAWSKQPALISISPYVREYASRYTDARIYDIDNPISAGQFDICWRPEQGRIFSAAVICRRKNTLALVMAIKELLVNGVDVHLVLAGAVTEAGYFAEICSFIDNNQLGDYISVLGGVSRERIGQELSRANVFALVSREENSPMGIEEAMAVGVPVVTSNRCGMPYMVRHGETGFLVNQENPQEIADAISKIVESESTAAAMSTEAIKSAQSRFHPAVVARQTMRAYSEIIDAT